MFGYVRALTPELRVREHEYYKGAYCGLCHAMGKCTGQCSRLSLSYDFLILALARIVLKCEKTSFSQKRCILHPFKSRNVMTENSELDFCAYASSLLTYHKVKDDIKDEGFLKRTITRIFLLPTASVMRHRALRRMPDIKELDGKCTLLLSRISEIEGQGLCSVDVPAQAFGELLAEFFAFSFEGASRKIAYSLGLHIGRWIYIADALDDIDKDIKRGNYNPFLKIYSNRRPNANEAEDIALALKNELFGAEAAADLIEFQDDPTVKNIIYNILYLGMPEKIRNIISKFQAQEDERTNDSNE